MRWLPAEQLHVTLAFIGAMPPDRVGSLAAALADVASALEPFGVRLGGTGGFGGRGRQAVAWIGLDAGRAAAVELAALVVTACRAVGVLPAAADGASEPAFRPHLTVARRSTPGLAALIEAELGVPQLAWRADALVLYRSHLGAPAVRHEVLARLPFARDLPPGHAAG